MDLKERFVTTEDVVILPGAMVNGDVTLGRGCSVWFNAVIRGDVSPIRIGEDTNIQDNAVLHTSFDLPLTLGRGVTVGHGAILHSCTVEDNVLIGMGAIILDGAVIGRNSIVGAGTLVTKNTQVPPGSMVLGSPAKVKRALTGEEIAAIRENAQMYLREKERYR